MATGTRAQKHSEEQIALLMQMITDGQQQQQLIAQEQRAWREELVKEQRAQKERQEQYEAKLQKWQEGFAQMQQQQHQQVMTEYRQLMQTQAKEQLSRHELLVQQLGQLEQRQGQEGRELVEKQAELREDLSGLKDRIDTAQSEEQQRFADLSDQVLAVESRSRKDVGIAKEELQFKQYELGQAHEELKAEVAELGKKLAARESTLHITAPEFTPASSVSTGSGCNSGDRESARSHQRPPPYDGRGPWDAYRTQFQMLATVNGWSTQEKAAYLAVSLKGAAVNVLNGIPADQLYDYDTLLAALEARFGNSHQAELNRMKLKNRVRKREEGLTELAEDVEKLIRLAYPEADPAMMEVLGIDHFIDALHEEEMRLKVRQSRPKTLREAVRTALELESFHLASRQRTRSVRGAKIDCSSESEETATATEFQKQMLDCLREGLQQVLAQCSKTGDSHGKQPQKYQQQKKQLICWGCEQPGHVRRNCPKEKGESEETPRASTAHNEQGNDQ